MHRVVNYGSFMQAYALKRSVEALGHSVEFRDFRIGQPRHLGEKVVLAGLVGRIFELPTKIIKASKVIRRRIFRKQLDDCLKNYCWPLLGVSTKPNYDLRADVMIVGSDEVFNYTQNHGFAYVPCLFGYEIDAPIIATYAASAGYADSGDVKRDGMTEELCRGFARFTSIAVRDKNTQEMVKECTGSTPLIVLDPTLLYDFSAEMPQKPVLKPGYLLIYAYEGRMESQAEIADVRAFARKENLRVVSVGFFHEWCDENIVVTPFDLLRIFADAAYVVTDTFHGTIFAMKAENKFATLIRENSKCGSNANKVGYLLEQFGMRSRILGSTDQLAEVLTAPVPYDEFRERQAALQKISSDYLTNIFAKG